MKRRYIDLPAIVTVAALLLAFPEAFAQAPSLGTAASFGVLAGSSVTNTGPTTVRGDVGVSPGTSVTGLPPGSVTGGTIHSNDAPAQQAQNDAAVAYNALAGLPCGTDLSGQDLGAMTLAPGVYCFTSSAQLNGTLTLDAAGDPNAQFIVQIGSTLMTAGNSFVRVINGGQNCNVYWQVGGFATLGTATAFAGNILALTSITARTGANVSGRLLARNGAVALDTNSVAVCPACAPITLSPSTFPNAIFFTPYSQAITATGGTGPYSFTIIDGSLFPGLSLSATGTISGTPNLAGTSTFTVGATDANGCFGSRIYTMEVTSPACPPSITLSPTILPAATAGVPYGTVTLTASGGTPPYGFQLTSVGPPGLVVLPNGVIGGVPTQSGSFTFSIGAQDGIGCFGTQIYSLLVGCQIIVGPATLPAGTVGAPYGPVTFTASGGTGPYSFAVSSGNLPPGLTLSAGGTLSGTPASASSAPFTIMATDSVGCVGSRTYTISFASVGPPPPIGGDTLDTLGLAILIVVLGAAGVLFVNRFTT